MRGPATTTIRSSGTSRLASGKEAMTRRRRWSPTPDPPTVTMQTFSSGALMLECGGSGFVLPGVGGLYGERGIDARHHQPFSWCLRLDLVAVGEAAARASNRSRSRALA